MNPSCGGCASRWWRRYEHEVWGTCAARGGQVQLRPCRVVGPFLWGVWGANGCPGGRGAAQCVGGAQVGTRGSGRWRWVGKDRERERWGTRGLRLWQWMGVAVGAYEARGHVAGRVAAVARQRAGSLRLGLAYRDHASLKQNRLSHRALACRGGPPWSLRRNVGPWMTLHRLRLGPPLWYRRVRADRRWLLPALGWPRHRRCARRRRPPWPVWRTRSRHAPPVPHTRRPARPPAAHPHNTDPR